MNPPMNHVGSLVRRALASRPPLRHVSFSTSGRSSPSGHSRGSFFHNILSHPLFRSVSPGSLVHSSLRGGISPHSHDRTLPVPGSTRGSTRGSVRQNGFHRPAHRSVPSCSSVASSRGRTSFVRRHLRSVPAPQVRESVSQEFSEIVDRSSPIGQVRQILQSMRFGSYRRGRY